MLDLLFTEGEKMKTECLSCGEENYWRTKTCQKKKGHKGLHYGDDDVW